MPVLDLWRNTRQVSFRIVLAQILHNLQLFLQPLINRFLQHDLYLTNLTIVLAVMMTTKATAIVITVTIIIEKMMMMAKMTDMEVAAHLPEKERSYLPASRIITEYASRQLDPFFHIFCLY
jgi:hypothetical protein